MLFQELKVKISELEKTLTLSRSQLEAELETQKKAIANFTTQVNAIKHL